MRLRVAVRAILLIPACTEAATRVAVLFITTQRVVIALVCGTWGRAFLDWGVDRLRSRYVSASQGSESWNVVGGRLC